MSCLVYLPRDRYTTAGAPARWRRSCSRRSTARASTTPRWSSESVLARLHFVVRVEPRASRCPSVDPAELEARLVARDPRRGTTTSPTRCATSCGEEAAPARCTRYADAFPEAYKEDFPAPTAVADLQRLEALQRRRRHRPEPLRAARRRAPASAGSSSTASASRSRCPQVLPRAAGHGRRGRRRAALRDRPARRRPAPGSTTSGCATSRRGELAAADDARELFQDAFAAVWRGEAESDGFNALVLRGRADLAAGDGAARVRQVPAPGRHDVQPGLHRGVPDRQPARRPAAGRSCSRPGSTPTSRATGGRGADELIAARRSPARSTPSRASTRTASCARFLGADPGHAAHQLLPAGADGEPKPYSSFKLDPHAVPDLPAAAARRSRSGSTRPRVEGVHLRFGPVARGGLRWSDRREDFRTEVLGLVKAQMVKNAVIVPVGAKGGFVVKRLPRPGGRPRGVAGRGHRLLPDVHQRPARPHRQPRRRRQAVVPPPQRRAARRRRHLPGRRRRQGHRDVLRHRQQVSRSTTASGSATRSPPAARSATTTRRWASPRAAPGSR